MRDCLEYVNQQCKRAECLPLYGLRVKDGRVFGRILPEDLEIYWLPKWQLSEFHGRWIDRWIGLGGKLEEGDYP